MKDKNFLVMYKSKVPKLSTVLPTLWQLRRKREIKIRIINTHKARLNMDGPRIQQGVHYDHSYAPVSTWNSIRLLLIMTAVRGWHTKKIDYVAVFTEAPVERELYMKIPKGVNVSNKPSEDYVLKLHKIYILPENAGRVWKNI